jgi:hypothetical protein
MEIKQEAIRVGQYWYVDLSPVIGEEIGGCRKCLVVQRHHNLVRVRPLIYNGGLPYYSEWHERTVDISRLKEKVFK